MERFARLCADLECTSGTPAKLDRLARYFREVPDEDRSMAAPLLAGAHARGCVRRSVLRAAALDAAGVPGWLFDACRRVVGDFAETVALVVPPPRQVAREGLAWWMRERLLPLCDLPMREVTVRLCADWDRLDVDARRIYTRLALGTFRAPVAATLVAQAQASAQGAALQGLAVARETARAAPPTDVRTGSLRIDAVLLYAERATPKRYELGTYTFAVWDVRDGERRLTPIAKIASPLTADERAAIDKVVRKTTVERFGPVRSVTPTLVFEIAFAAVERSARHKSGIVLRAPRVVRRRADRSVDDAATLDALYALVDANAAHRA
jgi:ATP dependent DNA ligase-like protein